MMTRRLGNSHLAAFTLVELLASMAVSAIVLAAAAALSFAVSHAWAKSDDVNDVITHGRNAIARVDDRIRSARAIGFTDEQNMLIWREDADGDGYISQNELTLFRLDTAHGTLNEGQCLFASNVSAAARAANNVPVTAEQFVSSSFVDQFRSNPYCQFGPVAEYVSGLGWVLDADPPATRMVQMQLTLSKQGLTQALHSGMTLRMPLEVVNRP